VRVGCADRHGSGGAARGRQRRVSSEGWGSAPGARPPPSVRVSLRARQAIEIARLTVALTRLSAFSPSVDVIHSSSTPSLLLSLSFCHLREKRRQPRQAPEVQQDQELVGEASAPATRPCPPAERLRAQRNGARHGTMTHPSAAARRSTPRTSQVVKAVTDSGTGPARKVSRTCCPYRAQAREDPRTGGHPAAALASARGRAPRACGRTPRLVHPMPDEMARPARVRSNVRPTQGRGREGAARPPGRPDAKRPACRFQRAGRNPTRQPSGWWG